MGRARIWCMAATHACERCSASVAYLDAINIFGGPYLGCGTSCGGEAAITSPGPGMVNRLMALSSPLPFRKASNFDEKALTSGESSYWSSDCPPVIKDVVCFYAVLGLQLNWHCVGAERRS